MSDWNIHGYIIALVQVFGNHGVITASAGIPTRDEIVTAGGLMGHGLTTSHPSIHALKITFGTLWCQEAFMRSRGALVR